MLFVLIFSPINFCTSLFFLNDSQKKSAVKRRNLTLENLFPNNFFFLRKIIFSCERINFRSKRIVPRNLCINVHVLTIFFARMRGNNHD